MKIKITYSIIPDAALPCSLHFQLNTLQDACATVWRNSGGSVANEFSGEPEKLNVQTTKIITSLISELAINPVPDFVVGMEGTTYELAIEAGLHRVEFVWWETLPISWLALEPLVSFLDGYVQADHLNHSSKVSPAG